MALMQGYMFDEATSSVVDTLSMEIGWMGPLADLYYEPQGFTPFGAVGTVSVKSVTLNLPSPSAIPFEIITRVTDGTIAVAVTGTMPADTIVADAAGLNLSAATVNNPIATTGYGVRPVGGLVQSSLRPKLYQLPAALRAIVGDASGFCVKLLLAVS